MAKARKRAKRTKRRQVDSLSLELIEERLQKSILSASLALYILKNARKPSSKVIKELIEIEVEVGKFVGNTLQVQLNRTKMLLEKSHFLAGAFSFIPIKPMHPKRAQPDRQG